jgi:hypothetical protein
MQSPQTLKESLNAMYRFDAYRQVCDPSDIQHLQTELQYGFGPAVEPLSVEAATVELVDQRTALRIVSGALQTAWRDPELTARGVINRIAERTAKVRSEPIAVPLDLFRVRSDGSNSFTVSLKCREISDGRELVQDREEIVKGAFDDGWPRLISELPAYDFELPIALIHDARVAEEVGWSRPMRAYNAYLGQLTIEH